MSVIVRTENNLHFLYEVKSYYGKQRVRDMRQCFLPAQRELAERVAKRLERGERPFVLKPEAFQQRAK